MSQSIHLLSICEILLKYMGMTNGKHENICEKVSHGFSRISISGKSVDFYFFQKCDRRSFWNGSFWNEIFEK